MVMKMSRIAHKHIDEFKAIMDWLVYYEQTSLLLRAMKTAWPKVKKSTDIVPWVIDEFAENIGNYLIFKHLETNSLNIDIDKLFQETSDYGDFKSDWLPDYIIYITGKSNNKWAIDDFSPRYENSRERRK